MKYFNYRTMIRTLLLLTIAFLASTCFAQTTVEIDEVDSPFLFARSYEDAGLFAATKPENRHGILTFKSLKEERLCIVGANNDAFLLWLSPGDKIVLNSATGESTGGNEKINNYLNNWKENYLTNNHIQYNRLLGMATTQEYKDIDVEDYFGNDYVEKLQTSKKEQLASLENEKIEDDAFISYFSEFINSSYWLTLIETDRLISLTEHTTPATIFNAILKMNIDETILQQKNKIELLEGFIRAHEGLKLITPTYLDYIYQKAKVIKNEKVREYYVMDELQKLISRGETFYVTELFESAKPLVISTSAQKEYDELYARIKPDDFAKKQAVALNAVDLEGNPKQLSDFKGKYIYIDVWATWCAPCKRMTPFFMKLADQYKGQNIVFLSLSTDKVKDEQKWKDYVEEHFNESCVPIWTGSAFDNDFIREYNINTIPRFLLIDPDGNIFSSNFLRPNDPRITGLIDKLVKQNN